TLASRRAGPRVREAGNEADAALEAAHEDPQRARSHEVRDHDLRLRARSTVEHDPAGPVARALSAPAQEIRAVGGRLEDLHGRVGRERVDALDRDLAEGVARGRTRQRRWAD